MPSFINGIPFYPAQVYYMGGRVLNRDISVSVRVGNLVVCLSEAPVFDNTVFPCHTLCFLLIWNVFNRILYLAHYRCRVVRQPVYSSWQVCLG